MDFKVDWPKLLFKSRPQLPCRDIIHVATSISRRDINLSLCSLQLMSRHRSLVATSIYAFAGFNWLLLMSRHQYIVGTSSQVFCSLQLVVHDVATSISCRDTNSSHMHMPTVTTVTGITNDPSIEPSLAPSLNMSLSNISRVTHRLVSHNPKSM